MKNFNDLDMREWDKDLSEEQLKEWNSLYASYRAGSLLTGRVIGMDTTTVRVPIKKGKLEKRASTAW